MSDAPGELGPRGGRPVLPAIDDDAAGEPEIIAAADPRAVADLSAVRVVEASDEAIRRRGRADLALTGGSTPLAKYRRLVAADLRERVDWSRVHLWWGDDRFVPRSDPRSNVAPVDEVLLCPGGLPIPAANVHPFPTDRAIEADLGADWCAAALAAEVVAALPLVDGWPSFDLVFVGIGPDGHLLSVFPGSPALTSDRIALPIPAPVHVAPHVERVTLNPAILRAAVRVLAVATGSGKAEMIARILDGPRDPALLPGVLARRSSATWILDAAAAAGLDPASGNATAGRVLVRPARAADAAAVADVWLAAFAATYDFPRAHTDDEVRGWIRDELLPGSETWLAVDPDGSVAGFMSPRAGHARPTVRPTGPDGHGAREPVRPAGQDAAPARARPVHVPGERGGSPVLRAPRLPGRGPRRRGRQKRGAPARRPLPLASDRRDGSLTSRSA